VDLTRIDDSMVPNDQPPMPCVVTIDGPAAAGKSTVARGLADRLGWRFLDTGAMYRAVTFAAIRDRVDLSSEAALIRLVESLTVKLLPDRILMGEDDITESIRGVEVTRASRFVADSPAVRVHLTHWQREFAALNNVVTEGRDQGTLVFPDAFRKYYLTASDMERASRRVVEYQSRGESVSFESVLRDQHERDARDAARTIAPMKPAPGAVVIDTTGLSVTAVIEGMAREINDGLAATRTSDRTSSEVPS
jgi:CMP/dCMP kinase